MSYEKRVRRELEYWENHVLDPPSLAKRLANDLQNNVNELLPDKFNQRMIINVKKMVRATLIASDYTSDQKVLVNKSLEEREKELEELIDAYQRTAMLEGAGIGAGGILLGLAHIPLLFTIKMKFLFDTAKIYGHDMSDYTERLFLLYVFQLTFSKDEVKENAFYKVTNWEKEKEMLPSEEEYLHSIDWETFQSEYRDYIDFPKLLNMVPGVGLLFGTAANYRYLETLGDYAKNAFRHRLIKQ